jgi:ankyrin repeat protein
MVSLVAVKTVAEQDQALPQALSASATELATLAATTTALADEALQKPTASGPVIVIAAPPIALNDLLLLLPSAAQRILLDFIKYQSDHPYLVTHNIINRRYLLDIEADFVHAKSPIKLDDLSHQLHKLPRGLPGLRSKADIEAEMKSLNCVIFETANKLVFNAIKPDDKSVPMPTVKSFAGDIFEALSFALELIPYGQVTLLHNLHRLPCFKTIFLFQDRIKLCAFGRDIDHVDYRGLTTLFRAYEKIQECDDALSKDVSEDARRQILQQREELKSLMFALLDLGANPNIPDKDGWTLLQAVMSNKDDEPFYLNLIDALIDHGAEVNTKNKHSPPSALYRSPRYLIKLIQRGANANVMISVKNPDNSEEYSRFKLLQHINDHYPQHYKFLIFATLIDMANKHQDDEGMELHRFVLKGNLEGLQKAFKDSYWLPNVLNIKNYNGLTALDLAILRHNYESDSRKKVQMEEITQILRKYSCPAPAWGVPKGILMVPPVTRSRERKETVYQ